MSTADIPISISIIVVIGSLTVVVIALSIILAVIEQGMQNTPNVYRKINNRKRQ